MKELEKAIDQLKKENDRIEKAQNRAKLLNQKINKLKRNAETKRKVQKGGVFEAFEREITGRQEDTNNDLIYAFLDYVLSDNRNREKLKELTEIHLKEKVSYQAIGKRRDKILEKLRKLLEDKF